jgi:hypothetical protein
MDRNSDSRAKDASVLGGQVQNLQARLAASEIVRKKLER